MLCETKPETERQILYNLTYMCSLKRWNSQKQRVKWSLPGASGGENGGCYSKGTNFQQ